MGGEPEPERLDILSKEGRYTGKSAPRTQVHAEGLFHRAVHVWLYSEKSGQLLLQKRAAQKDSFPGLWDISSAGHISAGETSLATARRELEEELGIKLPEIAFEFLFDSLQEDVLNNGAFINNEFNDVYLVSLLENIPLPSFTLQECEVEEVKWMSVSDYYAAISEKDPDYVPLSLSHGYQKLFDTLNERYSSDPAARIPTLTSQLERFVPVTLAGDVSHLTAGDREAIFWTIKTAEILDDIFILQENMSNPSLQKELKERAEGEAPTLLEKLKYQYYLINKSPWSVLDENEPYLSTADSKAIFAPGGALPLDGYEGIYFRAAFPQIKPKGANFYPPDMDREEFELWESTLTQKEKIAAKGFFSVIRRPTTIGINGVDRDLKIVPYSIEYNGKLGQAYDFLKKASTVAENPSFKKFLAARAEAYLSNNYYDSDVAWMDLDSPVDVTIGPYETYEDALFGYKATFEAFIGIRDDDATEKVKLFGDHLQEFEDHLPEDPKYRTKVEGNSPIRVIQLLYASGDVKGAQTVAFNLPNDEKITKERGTAMVMLGNVSQAKFDKILIPIANTLISARQRGEVDFSSFYSHTLCHECCHGIGPHTITTPDGRASTARQELQELYSSLEEAKADIVGLWALHYLVDKGLLPSSFSRSMYVAFLAGCFRSVRFGLAEAHGRGQALQFNWIFEKGGFVIDENGMFSVNFEKVRDAVESLSREILTIQAEGNKSYAKTLLDKYGILSGPLDLALTKLEKVKVPVDIAPKYTLVSQLAKYRF